MDEGRVWNLEGVHNFRDYGGYPVAGGGRLKRELLWRSGQHFGASEADLARIAGLRLASVFDLRTSRERTSHPCRRPAGFAARVHAAQDPGRENAPHVSAAVSAAGHDRAAMRESMRRNYERIAFRPELIAAMRTMLGELAENRGASLVNCMAGKDRTGIAVAVVHLSTGVHRDDILADYELTNRAGDAEARIRAGAEAVAAEKRGMSDEAVRVLMSVEPEWLETAFAAMAERHGSIEGYLAEVLGVDADLRDRLGAALIEG